MTLSQGTVAGSQEASALLVRPFPEAGELLAAVQSEWDLGAGTGEQPPPDLPRPWEPATCTAPALREEIWVWLDDVADWINTQHTWDPAALIPACWVHHPHLIHEIAVIAEHRRRAGHASTSERLEEWHRYVLPAFLDRMQTRTRTYCDQGHHASPGRQAHARYHAPEAKSNRANALRSDVQAASTN